MKTIAIGSKTFVTGFQLAGIEGINVEDHNDLMKNVNSFIDDGDVRLILVSDDVDDVCAGVACVVAIDAFALAVIGDLVVGVVDEDDDVAVCGHSRESQTRFSQT